MQQMETFCVQMQSHESEGSEETPRGSGEAGRSVWAWPGSNTLLSRCPCGKTVRQTQATLFELGLAPRSQTRCLLLRTKTDHTEVVSSVSHSHIKKSHLRFIVAAAEGSMFIHIILIAYRFTWSSSCNFIHVSKTPVGETGALWPTAFNEINIKKGYFYSNTWHLLCFLLFIHYCVSLCWRENSILLYTCCYSRDILFFSSGLPFSTSSTKQSVCEENLTVAPAATFCVLRPGGCWVGGPPSSPDTTCVLSWQSCRDVRKYTMSHTLIRNIRTRWEPARRSDTYYRNDPVYRSGMSRYMAGSSWKHQRVPGEIGNSDFKNSQIFRMQI